MPNILCKDADSSHQICLEAEMVCDGDWDCADGEDEKHCVDLSDPDEHCHGEQWECQDEKQCIDKAKVCDGENDCTDGSDEMQPECGKMCFIYKFLTCQLKLIFILKHNNRFFLFHPLNFFTKDGAGPVAPRNSESGASRVGVASVAVSTVAIIFLALIV